MPYFSVCTSSQASSVGHRSGRVALIFFSGHGGCDKRSDQLLCGVEGNTWLGGVTRLVSHDVNLRKDVVDLLSPCTKEHQEATRLSGFQLKQRNCNIIIIDACRVGSGRVVELSPKLNTDATLVAYACQPDTTALDGKPGENGMYTTALLEALTTRNQMSLTEVRRWLECV
jgi:hypothetical protein